MKSSAIAICEPQCHAFEHAPFNAAVLQMVALAYPSAEITYYGEEQHLDCIKEALQNRQGRIRVTFKPIRIPDRESNDLTRLPAEFCLYKQVLAETAESEHPLIFCSATNTGLLALKVLMKLKNINFPVVAFVHGCLSDIAGRQPRKPWKWILGLKRILALPNPSSLRLIALSDSILRNVKKVLPEPLSHWSALDHVYLWPVAKQDRTNPRYQEQRPIFFGYLGVSGKGLETFVRLADAVAPHKENAKFMMVGFYKGPEEQKPVSPHISPIPDKPLSRMTFESGLDRLTYVVWTANPEHYRFAASGTFIDALAFLKPGIYLRNEYIAHYFAKLGDIGYLCDTLDEMVAVINEIIADFPTARYLRQIENIRIGRQMFEPHALSSRFKTIIASCEA